MVDHSPRASCAGRCRDRRPTRRDHVRDGRVAGTRHHRRDQGELWTSWVGSTRHSRLRARRRSLRESRWHPRSAVPGRFRGFIDAEKFHPLRSRTAVVLLAVGGSTPSRFMTAIAAPHPATSASQTSTMRWRALLLAAVSACAACGIVYELALSHWPPASTAVASSQRR